MARTRRSSSDGTIRTRLSDSFIEALEADWQANKTDVIKTLREKDVARYSELIGKLIVSEENAPVVSDSSAPKDSRDIANLLLRDVGLDAPSDDDRQRALEAYDTLITQLEQIRNEAVGLH